jgi:hypothetical protein
MNEMFGEIYFDDISKFPEETLPRILIEIPVKAN